MKLVQVGAFRGGLDFCFINTVETPISRMCVCDYTTKSSAAAMVLHKAFNVD